MQDQLCANELFLNALGSKGKTIILLFGRNYHGGLDHAGRGASGRLLNRLNRQSADSPLS
jgi:hypothetical protein